MTRPGAVHKLAASPASRDCRVAVLHAAIADDAPPDERDTLVQVEQVSAALARRGFVPTAIAIGPDLDGVVHALETLHPAFVFNLVESLAGSGRLIHLVPGLLETAGMRCTGAPARAMLLSGSKLMAKRLFVQHGLPTPEWHASSGAAPGAAGRWIVKSVWEDASIGMDDGAVVDSADVCAALSDRARRLGGDWFAERYVDGREFNLSLLQDGSGLRVLPIAEITFEDFPPGKPHIVGYAAKWVPESDEYRQTPRRFIDPDAESKLAAELEALARRCWSVFGLRGYARVDFRTDPNGRPWILEINANPCLTADAGFAAALEAAGIDYDRAIGWIADDALTGQPIAALGVRAL